MKKPLDLKINTKIIVLTLTSLLLVLGCDIKKNEDKQPTNRTSPVIQNQDERELLVGYWKLNSENLQSENISTSNRVARLLRFSNPLVDESKIYILDYCGKFNDKAGAVRTQFQIKEGKLITGIVFTSVSTQEPFNPDAVLSAPKYEPKISKVTNESLVLDDKYEYTKFEPQVELIALGDKSDQDLCRYIE